MKADKSIQIRDKVAGTFIILIHLISPEDIARLIEFLDLDYVDIYSHPSRDEIKPEGYELNKSPAPYWDKLIKSDEVTR